ncbi:MAG: transposase [Sphingobium sp.]|nr:transposase [Sphingobium sp.]
MSLALIALAGAALQPTTLVSLCGREAASLPAFTQALDDAVKARTMVRGDEAGLHIYNLDERSGPAPRTRIWMAVAAEDKAYPAIACFDYYYGTDGLEMKTNIRCDGEAAACAALAERLHIKKDPR